MPSRMLRASNPNVLMFLLRRPDMDARVEGKFRSEALRRSDLAGEAGKSCSANSASRREILGRAQYAAADCLEQTQPVGRSACPQLKSRLPDGKMWPPARKKAVNRSQIRGNGFGLANQNLRRNAANGVAGRQTRVRRASAPAACDPGLPEIVGPSAEKDAGGFLTKLYRCFIGNSVQRNSIPLQICCD